MLNKVSFRVAYAIRHCPQLRKYLFYKSPSVPLFQRGKLSAPLKKARFSFPLLKKWG
jgi:hypothetical protein